MRRPVRTRWLILGFLVALTVVAYMQRTAVSVAAAPMMPQLGLTQLQIGWLETSFLVSYTAFQFPGSVVGQYIGARLMLSVCGVVSLVATLAIPLLPSAFHGGPLFVLLLAAQFVLGLSQAPLFAMVSGVLERWFPPAQWALTQGISSCGLGLGGAAAPVLISSIMVAYGWRLALVAVALPMAALVSAWWWFGRDTPAEHRSVRTEELAELPACVTAAPPPLRLSRVAGLLANRNMVGLSLSYLTMNVVFYLITFWSFLYLVQARHMPVLQGGLSTALPLLGGAAGAAIGGVAGSALQRRLGARWGLRLVPLAALPCSCALLLLGAHAHGAGWALAALTLSFLALETTEACFWAASMEIGGVDAVSAGGILNTGGNIGGIIATPLVAWMSGGGNWTGPFVLGAASVLVSAAIWLVIDPSAAHAPRRVGAT